MNQVRPQDRPSYRPPLRDITSVDQDIDVFHRQYETVSAPSSSLQFLTEPDLSQAGTVVETALLPDDLHEPDDHIDSDGENTPLPMNDDSAWARTTTDHEEMSVPFLTISDGPYKGCWPWK